MGVRARWSPGNVDDKGNGLYEKGVCTGIEWRECLGLGKGPVCVTLSSEVGVTCGLLNHLRTYLVVHNISYLNMSEKVLRRF